MGLEVYLFTPWKKRVFSKNLVLASFLRDANYRVESNVTQLVNSLNWGFHMWDLLSVPHGIFQSLDSSITLLITLLRVASLQEPTKKALLLCLERFQTSFPSLKIGIASLKNSGAVILHGKHKSASVLISNVLGSILGLPE